MRLIFIDDVKSGMTVAKDIVDDDGMMALVRWGTVLNDQIIRRINECGINSIYIAEPNDDLSALASPKRGVRFSESGTPIKKPIISDQLRDEAIESLREIFSYDFVHSCDTHSSLKIIKHLDTVTGRMVDALMRDNRTFVNIIDLKSYDEYTYHHSLSVAVLSVAVAQGCGLDRSSLVRLGKCAMMHDIGKTAVPLEITQKSLKLDDSEWALMKIHPQAGYDYLTKAGIFDDEICNAVLCHHERFDGTGYPNGLKGKEIPLWSRIISVSDVYDALTSNRPYRRPMPPAEAVEYIMGGAGSLFDFEMVNAFIKRLEPYPVGSRVELSNGQIAVVMNTDNPTRPVVKTLQTGETMDLFNDRKRLSVVISRILQDN